VATDRRAAVLVATDRRAAVLVATDRPTDRPAGGGDWWRPTGGGAWPWCRRPVACTRLFTRNRPASQCPGTIQLGSASPPSAFGESVERGEHFRRTPHSVAGSTGRLDEDSRLGERVEVAVSVGGLDAQLLRQ
jgi:hypothetical protein